MRGNPRFAVTLAFVTTSFMSVLDTSIVNVALPSIDRSFRITAASGALTVVSYLTMLVVVMPISGWLGDRFGTRRVFLVALATFTFGSAVCGLAQSLPELVIARMIQGVGGGALLPAGMTMLYRAYSPRERLRIARVITIPSACGPVLGPTLGGVLVQELSWRWVFWINLPVGLIALVITWLSLVEHREGADGGFDLPGFLLSAIGVGTVVYGISQGAQSGWTSIRILVCLALGVMACTALIKVELRSPNPLLRLSLIRIAGYRQALAITSLCGASFSGMLFLVPLMLQLRDGYSPIQSGTSTFCEALGVMTASQVVSRIHVRVGERRLQLLGFCVLTALTVAFAVGDTHLTLWDVRAMMLGVGFGSGSAQLLNQVMAFDQISAADTGQASGLYQTARRFGGAIGVALLATVVASSRTAGGVESGYRGAFLAATMLAAVGMVVAIAALRSGTGLSRPVQVTGPASPRVARKTARG